MNEESNDDGFVKNIEEESNEDEYENKTNEKLPTSKKSKEKEIIKGRPDSSKQPKNNQLSIPPGGLREDSEHQNSHQNEDPINFKSYLESESEYKVSPSKDEGFEGSRSVVNPIIEKFSNYVKIHCINIENFWRAEKIYMTVSEFQKSLNLINFMVRENEFNDLVRELSNKNHEITIQEVCNKVEAWKHNENFMFEFIKEQALKKAQELKKRTASSGNSKSNLRPYSSTPYYSGTNRPISGISGSSGLIDLKMPNIEKKPPRNNSAYYLKKAKEKEQEVERLLQLTISRGKNEYEYECLIKMGEINEISQRVQPKITYRAFKGADGNLKVHVYELEKRIKDLTLDEFQREYNSVKIKDNESKKLKIWEVLNENKKNARFSPKKEAAGDSKKEQEAENQSKSINKNKRQADLKGVLLETMMLTNILKEQLQVLKNKGINGTYQGSPYGKKLMNSQSQGI